MPNTSLLSRLPLLPASFFAMTLGLAETGNAWRFAVPLWGLPPLVGELLQALAALSFIWLLALYTLKWLRHPAAARAEARDPVQSAFLALMPESLILMALAVLPYADGLAHALFWLGSAANLGYGAFRLASLWSDPREPVHSVPPLFLTFTASVLVNAIAAGVLGYNAYGWMLFGIGGVSWLVLDSVIAQQLVHGQLAVKTRNFMGIYMAPSVVALVAYQVLSGSDLHPAVVYALAGYALFLAAALLLAVRWLREQDFAPGYWAYTFGVATLAQGLMLMAQRSAEPLLHGLAATLFGLSLLLTAAVAVGSLRLMLRGAYFPAAAPVAA
ncbi:hypothetical protein [Rhodoferax sp.]|uniref:SLAC1 family transporter n=1 Tax=Rhodoferax sp. TaxID=50421 RepID=UPI00374D4A8E